MRSKSRAFAVHAACTLAVVAATALALAPAAVAAHSPQLSKTIYTCQRGTRLPRLASAQIGCANGEARASWARVASSASTRLSTCVARRGTLRVVGPRAACSVKERKLGWTLTAGPVKQTILVGREERIGGSSEGPGEILTTRALASTAEFDATGSAESIVIGGGPLGPIYPGSFAGIYEGTQSAPTTLLATVRIPEAIGNRWSRPLELQTPVSISATTTYWLAILGLNAHLYEVGWQKAGGDGAVVRSAPTRTLASSLAWENWTDGGPLSIFLLGAQS